MTVIGRPRSEDARVAVLHAVDDLLVEEGYAAMTMKGIAERAGVSKQTVYRWWSSKAEILFEAMMRDAADELGIVAAKTTEADIRRYLDAVARFLTVSPAGTAYRALVGVAQHETAVAELIGASDPLSSTAAPVVERAIERGDLPADVEVGEAAERLVGPIFFRAMTGHDAGALVRDDDPAYFLGSYGRTS